MAATREGRRAALKTLAALALLAGRARPVAAHPLPNTIILLLRDGGTLKLDIALPMHELQLALPPGSPTGDDTLRRYFAAHLAIESASGVPQPLTFSSFTKAPANNEHAGAYLELRIAAQAATTPGFDFANFLLRYDAIIHQIPNHSALVRTANAGAWTDVGVLTYDLVGKRVEPMAISLKE